MPLPTWHSRAGLGCGPRTAMARPAWPLPGPVPGTFCRQLGSLDHPVKWCPPLLSPSQAGELSSSSLSRATQWRVPEQGRWPRSWRSTFLTPGPAWAAAPVCRRTRPLCPGSQAQRLRSSLLTLLFRGFLEHLGASLLSPLPLRPSRCRNQGNRVALKGQQLGQVTPSHPSLPKAQHAGSH